MPLLFRVRQSIKKNKAKIFMGFLRLESSYGKVERHRKMQYSPSLSQRIFGSNVFMAQKSIDIQCYTFKCHFYYLYIAIIVKYIQ